MIVFRDFKARNANPFVSLDLNLFRQGLVRVVGRNGEGKSSVWHLMQFLYYGIHPNGFTKSEIMMDPKGNNFLLEGSFDNGDVNYTVAHTNKSKMHNPLGEPYGSGLFCFRKDPDGWKNISFHKALDTQKLIKELLGWTLEEWQGYVYLGQQTVHKLIMGTRSERQKYLSGLFNLDPLDTIHKHYESKVSGFENSVKEIERQKTELALLQEMLTKCPDVDALNAQIEDAKFRIEDATFLLKELGDEQSRHDEIINIRASLETYGEVHPEQEEQLQKQIEDEIAALASRRALSTQCFEAGQKVERVNATLSKLRVAPLPEDYAHIMQTFDISIQTEEKRLRDLRAIRLVEMTEPAALPANHQEILLYPDVDLRRTEADIQKIKSRPAPPECNQPFAEDLDDLVKERSDVGAAIKEIDKKMDRLKLNVAECPTCGSELNPEHRDKEFARLRDERDDLINQELQLAALVITMARERDKWTAYHAYGPDRSLELPELEKSIEQYKQKLEVQTLLRQHEAWERLKQNEKSVAEIPAIELAIKQYNLKLQYRQMEKDLQQRDSLKAQHNQLASEQAELDAKYAALPPPQDIQAIRQTLEAIKKVRDGLQRLQVLEAQSHNDVVDQYRLTALALEEAQVKIAKAEAELKQISDLAARMETLASATAGQDEILREKAKCEQLTKAYGKAGKIRELQLSKFTKYLDEALTCHTFQHLPKHRIHFSVGDGIGLDTSKEGCRPYDVCGMSGGEKGALSGALMFALDDMQSPERRTSLKIIDELEAAFDPERKQEFLDTMLPSLRDRAETVIIISHTPIFDKTIFDRTWKFKEGKIEDISGEVRERT